jgi:conjugal transfer ATP-binding protein TraC
MAIARLQIDDYDRFHTDAPSLPDYLPYIGIVDDLVLLTDRTGQRPSVGMLWEMTPARVEAAPEGQWAVVSNAIDELLQRLPEESTCQFFLLSDREIQDTLDTFLGLTRGDGVPRRASEELVQLYQQSAPLFEHKGMPFSARRLRTIFTVRLWPTAPAPIEVWRAWVKGTTPTTDWLTQARVEMDRVERLVTDHLHFAGARMQRLSADASKALLRRFLNPGRTPIERPYRDDCRLREQLLETHPQAGGQGITCGATKAVVLTAIEPPEETDAGMFVRELQMGQTMAALVDLFPDFCLILNIQVLNQAEAWNRAKWRKRMAWAQRLDPFSGFNVESKVIGEDIDKLLEEVYAAGKRVLAVGIHTLVTASPVEMESELTRVTAGLARLKLSMIAENIVGASLFVHCLPLGCDPATEVILRRTHPFVSANVADLAPVFGYFRGIGAPKLLYLSRRGEPVPVDLFAAATAAHFLIVGVTGTGKSFLTNDMILMGRRLGIRVVVFDKGDSYGRLCALLGGQHVIVEPETPLTINPFAGTLTQEKLALLTAVVTEMAQGRTASDLLSKEHEGMLERAIVLAYQRQEAEEEVTLSDVARVLRGEMGTEGRRLELRLEPYLHDGRYGHYFDGPNQLTFDRDLTVFELGRLDHEPELQTIMMMVLLYRTSQLCASEPGRQKFVISDEASAMFQSENAARFLGEAARMYRRYDTALGSITQQPRDFLQSRGGQAVRDNTDSFSFATGARCR